MRFFSKSHDGGENSGVTGYFLVEIKPLFSVVLLRFSKGTRDAYHSHAFNALTLWLKGRVREHKLLSANNPVDYKAGNWKYTRRDNVHKVEALETSWALTFRGPWYSEWYEYKNGKIVKMTHGRVVLSEHEV
jgi:quercetin dioxygenase-like cupin family protein